MEHAITHLEIALDAVVTNEPINRALGNAEQADLDAAVAADIRQALEVLKSPR